ncbi:helix-turn-helix domain-containing protein [Spiroplasma floricola]|uniref:XRE family transcriptional regulator n=1 Tax=Spiroplasma floricola 23-6 TaxID=1336749 RepID=A0A2K8SCE5_9MOLU|nr:helix-turn-helix transcriptional regulator [Spiroplasma floricola]AUB31134.1 XRE family transcriptional regulator [Spiroplasma floricola 23-6]
MKKDIIITFSKNMKRIRVNAQLTQEELSFRSQLHRNYISDSERGKRNISLKSVEKIAKALNVEPIEFFREIEE